MITWGDAAVRPDHARAVLFDFDGTLADTKPTIVEVATTVLGEFGLSAHEIADKVDDIIGPPFPDAFSIVFGLSAKDATEITRRYRAIYFGLGSEAWPFFPGISELLARLGRSGRLVGAASSKRQGMTERGIADNGATALFDVIVGKTDGVCDTKADAIAAALARLGVDATEAVMVGDRRYDVEGAAEVGVPCVGVLYGNTAKRDELSRAGAVAIVDTVDELGRVLIESRGMPTGA